VALREKKGQFFVTRYGGGIPTEFQEKPMNEGIKASVYEMTTYVKDGVTYVPHYRNNSIFVGPGYPRRTQMRYTEIELQNAGATRTSSFLWSRGSVGEVSDKNP
jgi:hypothetical protein